MMMVDPAPADALGERVRSSKPKRKPKSSRKNQSFVAPEIVRNCIGRLRTFCATESCPSLCETPETWSQPKVFHKAASTAGLHQRWAGPARSLALSGRGAPGGGTTPPKMPSKCTYFTDSAGTTKVCQCLCPGFKPPKKNTHPPTHTQPPPDTPTRRALRPPSPFPPLRAGDA